MKTVTIYTIFPLVGGNTTIARSLALFYAAAGIRVRVLARRQSPFDHNRAAVEELRAAGVRVILIGGLKGSWRDRLAVVEALLRGRGRGGVLLSIGMGGVAALLARWGGFSRSFFYYINHDPEVATVARFGRNVRRFDAILAISPASCEPLRALDPPPREVRWIPQFSEIPVALPPEDPGETGPWRFGFVGSLLESKGLLRLFEMWKKNPALGTLQILGDGPLRARVEQAARDDARIIYGGRFLPSERAAVLTKFFSEIDVLLVPSLGHGEGIPTVILEALNFGRAVLSSDGGGVRAFGEAPLAADFRGVVTLCAEAEWPLKLADFAGRPRAGAPARADVRARYLRWFSDEALAPKWRALVE